MLGLQSGTAAPSFPVHYIRHSVQGHIGTRGRLYIPLQNHVTHCPMEPEVKTQDPFYKQSPNLVLFLLLNFYFVHGCVYRSETKLEGFSYMGSRDRAQVNRLDSQALHPMSHLVDAPNFLLHCCRLSLTKIAH